MYYVSCQYLVLLLVCSVNKISAYRYAFIIAIAYIYIYKYLFEFTPLRIFYYNQQSRTP